MRSPCSTEWHGKQEARGCTGVAFETVRIVINNAHWKIRAGNHIDFDEYAVAGHALNLSKRCLAACR
jgi:hypothetical protein